MQKLTTFPSTKLQKKIKDRLPENCSTDDHSFLTGKDKDLPSCDRSNGKQEYRSKKRRLVLEEEYNYTDESEPTKVESSQLATAVCDDPSCSMPSLESYVHAQPIINPIRT